MGLTRVSINTHIERTCGCACVFVCATLSLYVLDPHWQVISKRRASLAATVESLLQLQLCARQQLDCVFT